MKKQWMKALSFVLALVMVLSVAPVTFATEAEAEPAGSAGITYEPWHIRYVGTEHSLPMRDQNLVLEEYIARYGR